MDKEKYYITTAIAYASKKPHIGNLYEIILADAIARYKRFQNYDVFFMTGTDEHGEKIQQLAKQEGIRPQEYVNNVSGQIKELFKLMNISYDKFIRTTDSYHEEVVKKIFKKFYDQGDIYLGEYEGWYCTPCESFWTQTQAESGVCPDCGKPLKKAKEEAYFFKLSNYTDRLIEHIEKNPEFIQPESRKNEMINNFLKPGLQDLCVTRTTFDWGVPVEFDNKHVIYVWIDALANYITGLGYGTSNDQLFKKYWPANVHLIGKDILRFHTIYWPIMLMALGIELPKQVFGHPWLLYGESKMSKSKGNVIYADELASEFGVDAVRYYLLREMPFGQDGSITYETVINRYNADLANVLGNLVSRTIAMCNKYFDGIVENKNEVEEIDKELIDLAVATVDNVSQKMDNLRVSDALDEIWTLLRRSNKYIDETTPWILCKDETKKDRLKTVLYNLVETIRISATLISSFMPQISENIFKDLNLDVKEMTIENAKKFNVIESGHKVAPKAEMLFARIDAEKKLNDISKKMQEEENKEEVITIDDFFKVKMKLGEIIKCENVEGSNKLLKSQVKIGNEVRQIVSGIAKYYTAEEMVGKKVAVVTNLKPIKLKGEMSEGMLLAAEDENGNVKLITCEGNLESGSQIG